MTYKHIITLSLALLMSLASNAFEVKSGQMPSLDSSRHSPSRKDTTTSRHHRWSIEASSSMMRIGD